MEPARLPYKESCTQSYTQGPSQGPTHRVLHTGTYSHTHSPTHSTHRDLHTGSYTQGPVSSVPVRVRCLSVCSVLCSSEGRDVNEIILLPCSSDGGCSHFPALMNMHVNLLIKLIIRLKIHLSCPKILSCNSFSPFHSSVTMPF